MSKADWEKGIAIIRAFGRTDYMYIKEIAPWAYDKVNDWIKVAIESAIPFDLADDWARELGQVDLARYKGAACGLLNPVHVGITVAGAIVDPRQIRALTAADVVSAAQSGVWSVGRTWALAVATDAVAAQVSNWPALYAMNLTQYISAACGLLNPIHVGITVAGAIVDPRSIRALTAADVVTADSLNKISNTALTARDWSSDFAKLDVLLSTRARLQPWYQTNFTKISGYWGGDNLAPHAPTIRWSYTVPAGRLAIVTSAVAFIYRTAAATTLGGSSCYIDLTTALYVIYCFLSNNTVGASSNQSIGQGAIAVAGDIFRGWTWDGSTGGTQSYSMTANIMVFNT